MIWAHQWGKTACDSLSYRSEHNEEDTAINPPKGGGKKNIPEEERKEEGVREAHNQYKHSIKLLQKGFWTVSRISSAEKSRRGSKYVWGAESKQVQTIQSATERRSTVAVCLTKAWRSFSLSESQHTITLVTPQPRCLYLFQETAYSFPRRSRNIKTASRVIVAQSPKYCSVLSPRQIKRAQTASVCFLITSSYPHKHSVTLWTVSEKGQNLPSTSNWNVPTEILSGYQLGYMCQAWHTDQMLHQREIQWLYPRVGEAVKNPEMQLRASALYCAFKLNQNKWRINN